MATEVDAACAEQLEMSPQGFRSCPGEPYHDDFFERTSHAYPGILTIYDTISLDVELLSDERVYTDY